MTSLFLMEKSRTHTPEEPTRPCLSSSPSSHLPAHSSSMCRERRDTSLQKVWVNQRLWQPPVLGPCTGPYPLRTHRGTYHLYQGWQGWFLVPERDLFPAVFHCGYRFRISTNRSHTLCGFLTVIRLLLDSFHSSRAQPQRTCTSWLRNLHITRHGSQ